MNAARIFRPGIECRPALAVSPCMDMTQTTETEPVTQPELQVWISRLDAMLAEHHKSQGYTFERDALGYTWGPRYARVYTQRPHGGRSAFCFVRRADGAILKPAGWKGPAKHARGNIRDADPLAGVTPYGAARFA